jgi:hypothetical protein
MCQAFPLDTADDDQRHVADVQLLPLRTGQNLAPANAPPIHWQTTWKMIHTASRLRRVIILKPNFCTGSEKTLPNQRVMRRELV